MSRPLSPLKGSALNMVSDDVVFAKPLAPPADKDDSEIHSDLSSSFQTEVSHVPHQYGQQSHTSVSTDRQHRSTSPNKRPFDFAIHEDEDAENNDPKGTLDFSPHKRSHSSSRSSSQYSPDMSPSKVPLPESSPFKTQTSTVLAATPSRHGAPLPFGSSALDSAARHGMSEYQHGQNTDLDDVSFASDDTGKFSNFSAVPNLTMTRLAHPGERNRDGTLRSPLKRTDYSQTPVGSAFATPQTARASRGMSQTPRQHPNQRKDDDSTNLLLDFTDQFNVAASRNSRPANEPRLLSYINQQRNPSPSKTPKTPGGSRSLLNLLDFELPPAPTPRSVPSITIRQLESLKSTYLSEISSLKASLSGRDAEVASLKSAVADAERRAGEAVEEAQDERNAREYSEREKDDWVKKGKEIEELLRNVKEEVMKSEKEKEDLVQRLEDAQQQREEAEFRARNAETKANVAQSEVGVSASQDRAQVDDLVEQKVSAQIDARLEALARELHGVYKKKHETKVSTLKKTYEVRYDKKCSELQARIEELLRSNEELEAAKEVTVKDTISEHVLNGNVERAAELQRRVEQQSGEMQEQKAKIAGLIHELDAAREEQMFILQELEKERVEKGELVAAVDEMLALQADTGAEIVEDFRKSMTRPTSLRPSGLPTPGESKIGRPGSSHGGPKSRMMSNIAKMGAGRGSE